MLMHSALDATGIVKNVNLDRIIQILKMRVKVQLNQSEILLE